MVISSSYLLYTSRLDEVYTVWSVVHPAFFVFFFVATALFVWIILSSELTEFKILFSIVHSVLSLTFYAFVFPYGRIGVPQMVLGEIRLVFDNITPLGLSGWQPTGNIILQILQWSRDFNLETLSNVILARMFGIDVYWTNLLLIPILWSAFVPGIAFAILKELTRKQNISVFAGLTALLFPNLLLWGTFSTHNSLGFIFFFGSLYIFLRYLSSNELRWLILMLFLSSASFLSHFLPGIMSFSLLILTFAFRLYTKMKQESPMWAKINLLLWAVFCACLLPLSLLLNGFLSRIAISFSFDKLTQYSMPEALGLIALGQLIYFDLKEALVFGLGSLLGLIGIVYYERRFRYEAGGNSRTLALFLLIAFLIMLVDYRIIKVFMVHVPFEEERVWVFSDLIALPFVSLLIGSFVSSIDKRISSDPNKANSSSPTGFSPQLSRKSVFAFAVTALLLSSWVTVSVHYAYPTYGILQTTPYEVEAVKYIEETTSGRYIVIGDPWIIFAGEMFVGVQNPRAFYFFYQSRDGVALFIKMKDNPSNETLLEAMKFNNATTAYFVVEQPRLSAQEFNRIVQQAQQNNVALVGRTFGNGKLYIYYYRNE